MEVEDRERLGQLIKRRRLSKFGTKSKAYRTANVNSATWDKAEGGESVRPDLLSTIVRTLWPETDGDVQTALDLGVEAELNAVFPAFTGTPVAAQVAATAPASTASATGEVGLSGVSNEDLLAEVERRMSPVDPPAVQRATGTSFPDDPRPTGSRAPDATQSEPGQ